MAGNFISYSPILSEQLSRGEIQQRPSLIQNQIDNISQCLREQISVCDNFCNLLLDSLTIRSLVKNIFHILHLFLNHAHKLPL